MQSGIQAKALESEIFRKSLHLSIFFAAPLASISMGISITALIVGMSFYSCFEFCRIRGKHLPFITEITLHALRRDMSPFFDLGPITSGLGALFALLLFPEKVAWVAIAALALGDGLAGVFGRISCRGHGTTFSRKSVASSFGCYCGVYLSCLCISQMIVESLIVATVATLAEALPLRELDNIVMPIVTGIATTYLIV